MQAVDRLATICIYIETDMKMLKCQEGLIYRNPSPHVRSVHAYFPSTVKLPNGDLLATAVLGEAFEAVNLRTHLFRSRDQGATWMNEGALFKGHVGHPASDYAKVTVLPDGRLIAYMMRHDRAIHPDAGLTNPVTLGFVPTEQLLLRSTDGGHSWSKSQIINPPLRGPSFEMCAPVTVLRDGRWLIPTHTWPDWGGDCPEGLKMVALVSHDQGWTWPEYLNVMSDPDGRVFFWESKIIELPDGRLLATAWVYDDIAKADRPNHYALSSDNGKTWSAPNSTGLHGQTLTPGVLDDGSILCVYRRMDRPGLWANISRVRNNDWINETELPLWGNDTHGQTAVTDNMSHNFSVLRFGAPCLTRMHDDDWLVSFWCYEDLVAVIRWIKIKIQDTEGYTT